MSFATHFSLSNLMADGGSTPEVAEAVDSIFGGPKKDVMDPLAFGFLAASAARSVALRLMLVAIVNRRRVNEVRLRILE